MTDRTLARTRFATALGAVMIALAAYVILAPVWTRRPVTSSRFLDVTFALFFAVRGWIAIRRARR